MYTFGRSFLRSIEANVVHFALGEPHNRRRCRRNRLSMLLLSGRVPEFIFVAQIKADDGYVSSVCLQQQEREALHHEMRD